MIFFFSQLGHIKAVQDSILVNGDTLIVESRRATAMYFPSGLIRTHRTSSAIRNVLVFRKLSCLLPGCHLVHKGVSKDRKDKNYAGTLLPPTRLHMKFYLKIVTTYKRKKITRKVTPDEPLTFGTPIHMEGFKMPFPFKLITES